MRSKTPNTTQRLINILKVLLKIDNIEIIKYTIESFIEELEDDIDQAPNENLTVVNEDAEEIDDAERE